MLSPPPFCHICWTKNRSHYYMMKLEIPDEPILICSQNAPPTSHNALLETEDENNFITDTSFESGVTSGDPATQC